MTSKGQSTHLLIIEDNPDHWVIIQTMLKQHFPRLAAVWVTEPRAAIEHLTRCVDQQQPWPTLILLDMYLPERETGLQLLQQIKTRMAAYCPTPVIVLSHSGAPRDVEAMYKAGCSSYLVKPIDLNEWHELISKFKNYWWDTVTRPQFRYYA